MKSSPIIVNNSGSSNNKHFLRTSYVSDTVPHLYMDHLFNIPNSFL